MKERLLRLLALGLILAVASTGCILGSDDDPADPEPIVPEVTHSVPADDAVHFDPWDELSVQFSVAMDTDAVEDATTLSSPDRGIVACNYTWYGTILTIEPQAELERGTTYTLTVDTGAMSAAGEPLAADFVISFTTLPDHPVVLATFPEDGATGVGVNASPWIQFSEWMNTGSVEAAISVDPAAAYTLEYGGFGVDEFTIDFDSDLATMTTYTITIDASAEQSGSAETLGEDYVFSFTTGSGADETPPSIVSYDPPNGATNVSRDIGQIVITFSEPVGDLPEPEGIDLRLYGVVYLDPELDPTGTVMTIPLLRLPAGVELWVDLAVFTDMFGNESANPPVYAFGTAGESEPFPADDGDRWIYWREETSGGSTWSDDYLQKVENVSGDAFDLNRYRPEFVGPRSPDEEYTVLDGSDHYELSGGVLYWITQSEESEGAWHSEEFVPPVEWLHFPLTAGSTWSGNTTFTMDATDARVAYSGEVLRVEDLSPTYAARNERVAWRFDRDMSGFVFPDCAVVEIEFTVEAYIEGAWETAQVGTETSWYCPGLGKVYGTAEYTEYNEGGSDLSNEETALDWWLVGQ